MNSYVIRNEGLDVFIPSFQRGDGIWYDFVKIDKTRVEFSTLKDAQEFLDNWHK